MKADFSIFSVKTLVCNDIEHLNLDVLPFLAVCLTHDLCTVGSIGLATFDVTVLCVASVLSAQHCDGEGSLALQCHSSSDTRVHWSRHTCAHNYNYSLLSFSPLVFAKSIDEMFELR